MIIVADTDNRDRGLGSTPCRTQTHIPELCRPALSRFRLNR